MEKEKYDVAVVVVEEKLIEIEAHTQDQASMLAEEKIDARPENVTISSVMKQQRGR